MKAINQLKAFAIEKFLKHLLALDPQSRSYLKPIIGKRLQVHIDDLKLSFLFQITESSIKVFAQSNTQADIVIKGSLINLIRLGLAKNTQAFLTQSNVSIQGDLITLQHFQEIMQSLDFDWHGKLSKLFGPSTADKILEAKEVAKTGLEVARAAAPDFIKKQIHAADILPTQKDADQLYDQIDQLKETVDRVEAKLKL